MINLVAGILFSEHSLNILRIKSVYKIAYIGFICAKIGLFSLLASNSHSSSANYKVIGFGAAGASAGSRPSANYFIIVLGFGLLLTLIYDISKTATYFSKYANQVIF